MDSTAQPACGFYGRQLLAAHYSEWVAVHSDTRAAASEWRKRHHLSQDVPAAMVELLRPLMVYRCGGSPGENGANSAILSKLHTHLTTRLHFQLSRLERIVDEDPAQRLPTESNPTALIEHAIQRLSSTIVSMLGVVDLEELTPVIERALKLLSAINENRDRLISARTVAGRGLTLTKSRSGNCPLETVICNWRQQLLEARTGDVLVEVNRRACAWVSTWTQHCKHPHVSSDLTQALSAYNSPNSAFIDRFASRSSAREVHALWLGGRPDRVLMRCLDLLMQAAAEPLRSSLEEASGLDTDLMDLCQAVGKCSSLGLLVIHSFVLLHRLATGSAQKDEAALTTLADLVTQMKIWVLSRPERCESLFCDESPIPELSGFESLGEASQALFKSLFPLSETGNETTSKAANLRIRFTQTWRRLGIIDTKSFDAPATQLLITLVERAPQTRQTKSRPSLPAATLPRASPSLTPSGSGSVTLHGSVTSSQLRQCFAVKLPASVVNCASCDASRVDRTAGRFASQSTLYDFFTVLGSDEVVNLIAKSVIDLYLPSYSDVTVLPDSNLEALMSTLVIAVSSPLLLRQIPIRAFVIFLLIESAAAAAAASSTPRSSAVPHTRGVGWAMSPPSLGATKCTSITFDRIISILTGNKIDVMEGPMVQTALLKSNFHSGWLKILSALRMTRGDKTTTQDPATISYSVGAPFQVLKIFTESVQTIKTTTPDSTSAVIKASLTKMHRTFEYISSAANTRESEAEHIRARVCHRLWRVMLVALIDLLTSSRSTGENSLLLNFALSECRSSRFFNTGSDGLPIRLLELFHLRRVGEFPVLPMREAALRWVAELAKNSRRFYWSECAYRHLLHVLNSEGDNSLHMTATDTQKLEILINRRATTTCLSDSSRHPWSLLMHLLVGGPGWVTKANNDEGKASIRLVLDTLMVEWQSDCEG